MGRSARRHELEDEGENPLALAAVNFARLVSRNPTLVGGSTAFLVALTFVSANALWYQPHAHEGAFFATRDFAAPPNAADRWPDTTIIIERPRPARPSGDPRIREVQSILRELDFYSGDIDGIAGPDTRRAIADYQSKVGLEATGSVDRELLDHLGASPSTAGILPVPAPRIDGSAADDEAARVPLPADRRIMRLQAGLRAFGNDDMEVDGILGARTKAAIHEFQALFGLPETGEPDDALYAKMREIGLTD